MATVTVEEVKTHLRLDTSDDDAYCSALISAADSWMEEYLQRTLTVRARTLKAVSLCTGMQLPYGPANSITSITYLDGSNVRQTLANTEYELIDGRVYPAFNKYWPYALPYPGSVAITYQAGYAPADLPAAIKQGVLMFIGLLYENREQVTNVQTYEAPVGLYHLVQPWRLGLGAR